MAQEPRTTRMRLGPTSLWVGIACLAAALALTLAGVENLGTPLSEVRLGLAVVGAAALLRFFSVRREHAFERALRQRGDGPS